MKLLVFLCFFASWTLCQSACPDGYTDYSGKCYKYQSTRMTWQNAQNSCKDSGGYLAMVKDQQDQKILSGAKNALAADTHLWLGANVCEKRTYMFKGISRSGFEPSDCDLPDFCEYPYSFWSPNQPDFWNESEFCIQFQNDNTWNDISCTATMPSMCETDQI